MTTAIIELGRNSAYDTSTRVLSLEKHYFTPSVALAKVVTDGFGQLKTVSGRKSPWDRASLSNAGNGFPKWDLTAGIYQLESVQNPGQRTLRYLLCVSDSGEAEAYVASSQGASRQDRLEECAARHFPDVLTQRDAERVRVNEVRALAQEIHNICVEERESYVPETLDGIEVRPEFRELPSVDEFTKEIVGYWLEEKDIPREKVINRLAAPKHYVVTVPAFAKARTPEQAVSDVKKLMAEREAAAEAARKEAEEPGLPALKGTERQIAWAEQIRARAKARDPKNPALKRAKTARYWIDRRMDYP